MTREEIKLKCNIAWQEKFLELTGHKIGDIVTCFFDSSFGNAKQAYTHLLEGKGTIVMTDKGIMVKSCEKYNVAHSDYRNRQFRKNPYWRFEKEYVYMELEHIKL